MGTSATASKNKWNKENLDHYHLTLPKGDIKPMQGYKDGRHRLRVGKYRVVYRCSQDGEIDILIVMEIGSRGDIYK